MAKKNVGIPVTIGDPYKGYTMTVRMLRKALANFPDEAKCYAYEGEVVGIVVVHKMKQLGIINNDGSVELEGRIHG